MQTNQDKILIIWQCFLPNIDLVGQTPVMEVGKINPGVLAAAQKQEPTKPNPGVLAATQKQELTKAPTTHSPNELRKIERGNFPVFEVGKVFQYKISFFLLTE